ncbi:hypothetical protein J2853_003966 [Streptosporangium lutulentum]|uniref:Uncharacterized protein n=1 Tax=Streptosporangium lutulentum TaxID=1461250 RepID=A0ABT9QDB0_9ACTN|nr:hypothetical protein [Streptosporangium lutulentum]
MSGGTSPVPPHAATCTDKVWEGARRVGTLSLVSPRGLAHPLDARPPQPGDWPAYL